MSDVQFEGDKYVRNLNTNFQKEKDTFLISIAMKMGAKSFAQAQLVLVCIAILAVILTSIVIVMNFTSIGKKKVVIPPGAMMIPNMRAVPNNR